MYRGLEHLVLAAFPLAGSASRARRPSMLTFLVCALSAVFLLCIMSSATSAAPVEEKEEDLKVVGDRLKEARDSIKDAKEKEAFLLQESRSIDQKVASLEEQLVGLRKNASSTSEAAQDAEAQLVKAKAELRDAQRQLRHSEGRLLAGREQLGSRMVSIYKSGEDEYLAVLLGARSFKDFVSRFEFLALVTDQDERLIAESKKARDEAVHLEKLVSEKRALAQQEARKRRAAEREAALAKAASEANQASLESERVKKSALLEATVKDRKAAEAIEIQLEKESASIQAWLASFGGSGERTGTGKFAMPTQGRLTSPFGWRTHPISGSRRFHAGLDIAAPFGTRINASDSGTVIFAGWRGGYGKAIVIDHGGGFFTLYGHNQALLVGTGATVERGQQIAEMGSTGLSTGPHVHFEIILKGKPVNPSNYL